MSDISKILLLKKAIFMVYGQVVVNEFSNNTPISSKKMIKSLAEEHDIESLSDLVLRINKRTAASEDNGKSVEFGRISELAERLRFDGLSESFREVEFWAADSVDVVQKFLYSEAIVILTQIYSLNRVKFNNSFINQITSEEKTTLNKRMEREDPRVVAEEFFSNKFNLWVSATIIKIRKLKIGRILSLREKPFSAEDLIKDFY